jgi:hypothetical protein
MDKTSLIEGIIVLFLGGVALRESLHLISEKDPTTVYDVVGPGFYILFLSILLLAAGVAHLVAHIKKGPLVERVATDKELRMKMLGMLVMLGLYLVLINVLGYLVATVIFFLAEFRLAGVKSWRTCVLLTIGVTAGYYFVFIEYCSMVFPRGIFY